MASSMKDMCRRLVDVLVPVPSTEEGEPEPMQHPRWWQRATAVALCLGLALRLAHYMANYSLWLDEAMLALNLISRSFAGLTEPLAHNQGAPIFFLWIERAAVALLGPSELSLRLVPLLAGLASLFLMDRLARHHTGPAGRFFAVALFALVPSLINYSAEVKQYSVDVFFALAILLAYDKLAAEDPGLPWRIGLGLLGAVAIFFSHPATFMLAGAGVAALYQQARGKRWRAAVEVSCVGMAWVLAIGLNYWLFLSRLSANQELVGYWTEGFPRLTSVIGFVGWARSTFMDVFERTMDLELAPAAALAFLIGCYVVIKRRKRGISAALLLPWGFCFIAGLLHYYPFKDRLILFLIPSVVLIVAMGFESLFRPARGTLVAAIGVLLALTALSGIVGTMTEDGVDGFPDERLRPVLQRLSTESRPGDAIMLWRRSAPQFRYYAQVYDFPLPESRTHLTEGQDPRAILQPLLGGGLRVWLISAQKYGKVHARYAQENDVAVVRDEIQVGQSGAVLLISRAPR